MDVNLNFKGKQGNKPESPLFYFHGEKKWLFKWDLNPQPPAFKAVALPTEPLRQLSLLGSNHTSYICKAKPLISPDKQDILKHNAYLFKIIWIYISQVAKIFAERQNYVAFYM